MRYLSAYRDSLYYSFFLPSSKKAHAQKLHTVFSFRPLRLSHLSVPLVQGVAALLLNLLTYLLLYLLFGCDTDVYKSRGKKNISSSSVFSPLFSFSGSIVKRRPVAGVLEMASFNEENRAAPQREEVLIHLYPCFLLF